MIPHHLKLKNFLSYVDEEIDFTVLDRIVLINGINSESSSAEDNNGAGKSALLDAIEWVLYGRVRGVLSRELVKDDIIHLYQDGSRAKLVRIEFIFEMDEGFYKIMRERALGGTSSLEVKFSKDKKKWKNLTLAAGVNQRTKKKETSMSRTQARIEDILNANCDLFINSNFFEQMNTNTYALSKGSEKSNLLRQALYLDKWSDYAAIKKLDLRSCEKEIAAVEYQMDQLDADEIDEKLESLGQVIIDCSEKEKVANVRLKQYEADLKKQEKELADVNANASKINALKKEAVELSRQCDSLDDQVLNLESRQTLLTRSVTQLEANIEDAKSDIEVLTDAIGDDIQTLSTIEIDENDYSDEYQECSSQIAEKQGEANAIAQQKDTFQGDCPLNSSKCPRGSEEAHEVKIKRINGKIFTINKQVTLLKKKLSKINDKIKQQRSITDHKTSIEKSIEKNKNKLSGRKSDIKHMKETLKDRKSQIKDIKKQIKTVKATRDDLAGKVLAKRSEIEKYDDVDPVIIRQKVNSLQKRVDENREKIQTSRERRIRAEESIKSYQEKLVKVAGIKDHFNDLNDRRQILSYTIKMLSKDIPHQLIEGALPEIESYAQEYLTELSAGRMNIEFKTQRETQQKDKETKEKIKTDELYMELETDGVSKKYALCSGGEKTRADIAIHLAYSTFILNRSGAKIRSLFLDEVGMALDDTGKKALVGLLHRLVNEVGFKKVFVISQDEKFNKLFDCYLTVKKTSTGSQICLN